MWKIINYLPGVISQVKSRGYTNHVPVFVFKTELKRITGVRCDKTLAGWMNDLQDLGYIQSDGLGVIRICDDVSKPYQFGE